MAMTLVSTVTVGSGGAASIEFTNIPQTGKDLLLLISARATNNTSVGNVEFNNSASNYNYRQLGGEGSFSFSFNGTDARAFTPNASIFTASTFGNSSVYISNYSGSQNKSYSSDSVQENNGTSAVADIKAMRWSDNSAITSIKLSIPSGNFVEHSTASLYIIS